MTRFHFISLLEHIPWGGCEELWSKSALVLRGQGNAVSASVRSGFARERRPAILNLETTGVRVNYWGVGPDLRKRAIKFAERVRCKLSGMKWTPDSNFQIPDCDLVVISSPGNKFPQRIVQECIRRKLPYALIIQAATESDWPNDERLDAFRCAYEGASAAYFVSDENRELTCFQVGFRRAEFEVISNPSSVDRELSFGWPTASSCRQIAFVGRLEPQHKGVDLLLRAFGRPRWRERQLRLNLYGKGPAESSLRRMTEMLDLARDVSFRGFASSVEDVWRENEMLVLASRQEGLPLALIEAMMCGRPCLVTNVAGNPQHLTEGESGFIAAGATVDAVDEALERAWQARDRWRQMGERAYAAIRENIPKDPVCDLCERLTELAGSKLDRLARDGAGLRAGNV